MTSMMDQRTETNPLKKPLLVLGGLVLAIIAGLSAVVFAPTLSQTTGITILGTKTPWYFSRSAGTVAYLLTAGSTIWGLMLSSKIFKTSIPAALALAMHNILSWLAIVFAGLHAFSLLFDSFYKFTLADIIVPFIGPYRAGWVGLGVVGFYLMFITSISFNLRGRIGQKTWRKLHYLTFGLFVLVTIHGLLAGTDSSNVGMQWVYWGSVLIVLFLTNYRIIFSRLSQRA